MPIHDQGYQRYAGSRARTGVAWQVIARAGIRTVLAERKFLALMLLAWVPFLVRAVQVYVAANYSQASFLQPKGETFREFLETQALFVFFITIYVGAGLIASDRRANALQLYLAKPLSRWEYVAGKMAVLLTLLIAVTPDMKIFRDENFGPVAPLIPFKRAAEVVDLANRTQYGPAA